MALLAPIGEVRDRRTKVLSNGGSAKLWFITSRSNETHTVLIGMSTIFCGERAIRPDIRRFKSGTGIRAARPSPILTVPNWAEKSRPDRDRASPVQPI